MEPEQFPVIELPAPPRRNVIFFNEHGLRPGWRLLIFVSMLMAVYFGFTAVIRLLQKVVQSAGPAPPPAQPGGYFLPVAQMASELIVFLIVLFFTWVMSRIEHRKMRAYGLPLEKSALRRFITGYVFWGFLPLTVLLVVMRALHVFYFGGLALHGNQILIWGLLWGLAFLMVGLFEEFFFRGYALYTLAEGIGFWPAAVVLAILFAVAHAGNGGETRIGLIGVALFALFACAAIWRTGNLWLAIGAHAGWDWGQSYFYGVNDSGAQLPGHLLNPHIAGPVWLSGGTVGPEGSALTLLLLPLMAIAVLMVYPPKKRALTVTDETGLQPVSPAR
jgi:membrane protease YdiL (CAAX protease family)